MIPDSGGVFKVTAFDPNAVQKAYDATPYQEVKVYHSINSVKPSDLNSKFVFTEDETIRAMMIVGVTTDDLIKISEFDKRKIPGTPQIQRKIIDELEERRLKTFEAIVEARKNLLKELDAKKNKKATAKLNSAPAAKLNAPIYDKLKKKQLNSLITYQNKKKELQNSDESATLRLNELKKAKIIEMQRKKLEEQKKFRLHALNSIKKINNQNPDEIDEKIEQYKKDKMQEIQKSTDELRSLEESLSSTSKKHLKEKQSQIEALKTKISKDEKNLQKDLELMKENNDNNNKIIQQINDSFSNSSNAMVQYKKKEDMKIFMMKEREQLLNDQKAKLEKQLHEKDARIAANLKLISSQKLKHIRENRIILRKRSQSAAATKKLLEQQRIEKLQKTFQRQEEAIERAKLLKDSKNINLHEKAGQNWIKQKNGVSKAKKTTIQNHYKYIEKIERTIEKQEEIQQLKKQAEIKKIKEFRKNTIKKVQLQEEYNEFKKTIMIDSDADPAEIAQKFKVDLVSVEKMQKEIISSNIINSKK